MSTVRTVFVVDDDPAVRESLRRSLAARGYTVEAFASAREFLDATGGRRPGCLVLDVHMPEMTGTELQSRLLSAGSPLPIIFVSGHGDIPTAVDALRRGAIDFLEKPYRLELLVERIEEALRLDAGARAKQAQKDDVQARFLTLTEREREVFAVLTQRGHISNKEVAHALGISHRTVEVHRGRIMQKMGAESLTDLVRMATLYDEPEDDSGPG